MNDSFYFLDNNVVSHLTKSQLASSFFTERCRVPSEVFHEAGKRDAIRGAVYPTTVEVLEALTEVMATIDPSDTGLVDLYANKGNADPMLVACALLETRRTAELLVKPDWFVVSNDVAVRTKAAHVGVNSLTREAFFSRTATFWED